MKAIRKPLTEIKVKATFKFPENIPEPKVD
jgi:hypothetical protein